MKKYVLSGILGCCALLAACSTPDTPTAPTAATPQASSADQHEQLKSDTLTALTLLNPVTRSEHSKPGTVTQRDAPLYLAPAIITKFRDAGFQTMLKGYIVYVTGMEKSLLAVESVNGPDAVVHSCSVGIKSEARDKTGKVIPPPKPSGPQPPYRSTMKFKKVGDHWQMQTYDLDRSSTCVSA